MVGISHHDYCQITSRNHSFRSHFLDNTGVPIYIHEPNDIEEDKDEGGDMVVGKAEIVVDYENYHHKLVVDHSHSYQIGKAIESLLFLNC